MQKMERAVTGMPKTIRALTGSVFQFFFIK
jgi:hypothetical protein